MSDFKFIKLRFKTNSFHLFYEVDKCLYKKNGYKILKDGKKVQYYICIQCNVKGKIIEGSDNFEYTAKDQQHSHESPNGLIQYEYFVENLKKNVSKTHKSTREVYVEMLSE